MDRNQEYIRQLQERNRIKKMMTEKTEDDMIKEELERGFSTHFRGAHASKETSTSSKTAAVKPHVKVHTKSPPNDLLQRLMPPGLNQGPDLSPEQYRASSRGHADAGRGLDQPLSINRSNLSRDGSSSSRRNADRSRSGSRHQGQMNTDSGTEMLLKEQLGEEECEQVLKPKSTLSIESPCGSSRQNSRPHLSAGSTAPVMDLMQSSDLNELLLGHIKGLSAEQKIAMIQLLQHTNVPNSAQEPKVTMEPHVVESHRYLNPQKTSSQDFRDEMEQEHSSGAINPDQKLVNTTAQPHGLDATDKQDHSSISLNLKIKIYSTWTNAKNVILQGIRLRYFLEQGHVDVLQNLLPKVQSGLSTLRQSNEVIRSLPMLIGQGVRLNGAMWKAPISSENPIEIVFEGVLSQNVMDCLTSDSKPFDKTKFDLLMWNGASGGILANSSPAKDVDVFVDNKCIWSGEIPEESQISEISRAFEKLIAPSKFEGQPSARLKLVPGPRFGSAVGSQKLQLNPIETKKTSPTRSLIKSTIASPERILKQSDFTFRGDSSIPEWLRGSKVVERKASVLDSPLKTSRKEDQESDKREEEFGEFARISNGSPVANRSAAKSRRRRPRDAAIVSSAEIDGGSSIQYSTPMNRQESDSNLRKSMEAVEHAEKFNLNRLESTLSKRRPRRSSNASYMNHEDSFDGSQAGESFQIPEQSNSPSKSLDSTITRGLVVSSNIEFSKTLDFEASGTSKVSNKIEDVNLKLNNALTDLAEIMASLPRNRSEKRIKPIQLLNVPNDSKSRTESPLKAVSILAENNAATAYDGNQGLPIGTTLRIQIFSTYGDMNYVGLNGLEIFDDQGEILTLGQSIISIQAQPSDLGALPGYEDDPRKVTNLLDGVNTTKDDLHQWLAPHMAIAREYHPGLNSFMFPDNDEEPLAVVTIQFKVKQAVSMIRVYNFNKSRTHNQRGVKNCRFYLDSTLIYEGEIKRATGQMKICEADSQLLLFTKDTKIIERATGKLKIDEDNPLEDSMSSPNARPKTAIKSSTTGISSIEDESGRQSPTSSFLNEVLNEVDNIEKIANKALANPTTRVDVRNGDSFNEFDGSFQDNSMNATYLSNNKASMTGSTKQHDIIFFKSSSNSVLPTAGNIPSTNVLSITARSIRIEFDNTWGDRDYVGLSGIEVIGIDGKPIPIVAKFLSFDASSDMFGASENGSRKVDNVVSGINNTANDGFMWLAPLPFEKKKQFLEIKFPSEKIIIGLRFWNFNGNYDATLRGVRQCTIFFDDRPTLKYLLRPGPECDGVDFSQTLLFDQYFFDLEERRKKMKTFGNSPSAYVTPKLKQMYEAVTPPTGLLWKFTFFNNHGDDYYIGLDAIDMYDLDNLIVNFPRKGGNVGAVPFSVRDLSTSAADPLSKDPRTPDKLFVNSFNPVVAAKSCWLAPLAKCMTETEKEAAVARTISMTKYSDASEYSEKKCPSQLPKDNVVMVMFSYPVSVAAIRFYNYSKSVRRGAKDFAIHVDGKLVFLGTLQRADEESKCLPDTRSVARQTSGDEPLRMGQSVVFSHDIKVLNAHKDYVPPAGLLDQDVLCINERQVMVRSKTMYEPPNISSIVLENPSVDFFKRPTTSFFS